MVRPVSENAMLSAAERETLRCIASAIVPASEEFAVPGADDAAIFSDIVASLDRDAADVRRAIGLVDAAAAGGLAALPADERARVLDAFRASHGGLAATVGAVVARCYYRDDRVMKSIGMEPRPPYPLGFQLEQGDWSLLDPVRVRGRKYRETDQVEVSE